MLSTILLPILGLGQSVLRATTATSTTGCGKAPPLARGTRQTFTIQSGGRDRTYNVHLPSNYNENNTDGTPLILSFHGNGKDASYQESLSQFSNESYNPNAIAVYPQGLDNAWEGAPYVTNGVSDKAFINATLDSLSSTFCIDTSRIYATGKSLGGGFCNVLACSPTLSSRFAAFAPVSGALYTGNAANESDCHPARSPQPILEFHGLNDTTIPYEGGTRHKALLPGILDWLARWASRNGCGEGEAPEVTSQNGGNVLRYSYSCHTHHYAIKGLGHDWPSTSPNGDNSHGTFIDATPVIMEFFNKVQKP